MMTSATNQHKRCGDVTIEFIKVSGHQVLQLEVHSRVTVTDAQLGQSAAEVAEQQQMKQVVFAMLKPIITKYVETTQKKRKYRHNAAPHFENNVAAKKPDTLSIMKGANVRLGYLFKPSGVGHSCLLPGKRNQRFVGFTLLPERLVVYYCPYKNPLLIVKSSGYFQAVEQSTTTQEPLQHRLKNIVQKSGPKFSRLNGWRKPSSSLSIGLSSKESSLGDVSSATGQDSAVLQDKHTVEHPEVVMQNLENSLASKKEDFGLVGGTAEQRNASKQVARATDALGHTAKRQKKFVFKKAGLSCSSQSSQSEEGLAESRCAKTDFDILSVHSDESSSAVCSGITHAGQGDSGSHLEHTTEGGSDTKQSNLRDACVASNHWDKGALSKHCDVGGTGGARKHGDKSGANDNCDNNGFNILHLKNASSSQQLKLTNSYQGSGNKLSQMECAGKSVQDSMHLETSRGKRKLAPDLSNLLSDSTSDDEFSAAPSTRKKLKKKESAINQSVDNNQLKNRTVDIVDTCASKQVSQNRNISLKSAKNLSGINEPLKLRNKQTVVLDAQCVDACDKPASLSSGDEDTLLQGEIAKRKLKMNKSLRNGRQAQLKLPSRTDETSNDSDSVIVIERRPSREEAMRGSLKGIRNLSELTPQQVQWLVESNEKYLREIFQGKRQCRRHNDYKKGGQAKAELKFQIPMGSFTEEQDDQIMQLLLKMFCNRHDKYSDYVMKVMLAEIRIKIGMDVYGTSYEHAEQRMNSMDSSQDSMSLSRAFAVLRNSYDDTGISSE